MNKKEEILAQYDKLLQFAQQALVRAKPDAFGGSFVGDEDFDQFVTRAQSLIRNTCGEKGDHYTRFRELQAQDRKPPAPFESFVGIVKAAQADISAGLLVRLETRVTVGVLADFLDEAKRRCADGDHVVSGILVSVVFEDAIRRAAVKHGLDHSAKSEVLIDQLKKTDIFPDLLSRRLKASGAALRNKALHAKWAEYKISDVEAGIEDTESLLRLMESDA